MLRTLSLLSIVFVALAVVFLFVNTSLASKIKANENLIAQNNQSVTGLQQLVFNSAGSNIDINLFKDKAFAGYEEVVPFIPYLEKLLLNVDSQAEVAIKSQEDQIFLDHYADYKLSMKVGDKNKLFEAMDELHNSRFVTKIMNLTMHYKPNAEDDINGFADIELTIRLYLK